MIDVSPEFIRQLAEFVPAFAKSVLYAGPLHDVFEQSLLGRGHTRVHIAQRGERNAYDCATCFVNPADGTSETDTLATVSSSLEENGCGLLVGLPESGVPKLESLAAALSTIGLSLYRNHWLSVNERPDDRSGYIAFVVRSTYNPLVHARELTTEGHADWAFDVLMHIPEELQREPHVAAKIAAEKMVCLLAWDRAADGKDRLARFFFSQATFYNAVAVAPAAHEVYLCHGEFWKRVGDVSMRQRLLRSVFHAAPVAEGQKTEIHDNAEDPPRREFTPPGWQAPAKASRVLFVMPTRPHYGLDVLYYGFCETLGDANVVEFPYKPTLHGTIPAELANYPCMFNRAGRHLTLEEILTQLKRGAFNLVIYGDLEGGIDSHAARAIVGAAEDVPVVLCDAQDDPLDHWTKMNEFLGGQLCVYFKREMLACWDYGEHTVPLPFAYADERVPSLTPIGRSLPLFWAGHRQFGLRRLYLERIESLFDLDLNKNYSQDEYAAALREARIGLNIFGFGFDTVRYWEIPANGAMLLAERLPIHIPHNFVEGESAVFFDDLPELEEKLAYWMDRPEEAAAIAVRGNAHLRRYHTASARARQMLGWISERVPGWGKA